MSAFYWPPNNPLSSAQTQAAVTAAIQATLLNTNGSGANGTASTTPATLTKPANTVGFVLMCLDTSSTNIRWRIGSAASASAGQQLQPGRDTGYVPCGANISICAESGTPAYDIQWVLTS